MKMINIRDFIKKKKENGTMGTPFGAAPPIREESYRKKIFRHRMLRFYRFLFSLFLLGVLAVALYFFFKNRTFAEYEVENTANRENASNSIPVALGSNVLVYSNDGASCMNKNGEVTWNQTFEMQNPILDVCEETVGIGDYNGSTIYIMNTKAPVGAVDTKMPIRDFAVAQNGVVAAVLDDTNVTWIYLFDSEGKTLAYFKTTMKQSGYPLDVTISNDGTLVGVSYLYMDSGIMRTSIAFYNFGPVGQNEIDNFVSSYDYTDTVVPLLQFLDNETAVAVADSRLAFYAGDQKPVSTAETLLDEEIQGVFHGKGKIALAFNDVSGKARYRIDIYSGAGVLLDSITTDIEYSDIFFNKDKVVIYGDHDCLVHTIGGRDNFQGKFREGVQKLVPLGSVTDYILVTSDKIEHIKLK